MFKNLLGFVWGLFLLLIFVFMMFSFVYLFVKSLLIIKSNTAKRKKYKKRLKFKNKLKEKNIKEVVNVFGSLKTEKRKQEILPKKKKKRFKKSNFKRYLWHIRNTRFIKPIEFLKWIIIDFFRGKDKLKLFGIWAFTGYYGEGKTMGCVQFAHNLQKQYPHRNIKIYSNINVSGQVKRIENWEELLDLPPNSIFIFDESQADFSCNNREFPDDLLRKITQCRKRQLAMFMTSPVYHRMNINIRESVSFVIKCKNWGGFDRWFKYMFYRAEDYEQYHENKLKLLANRYMKLSMVIQDRDYRKYNTVEEVTSIKDDQTQVKKKRDVIYLEDTLKKFRNEIIKEIDQKLKAN